MKEIYRKHAVFVVISEYVGIVAFRRRGVAKAMMRETFNIGRQLGATEAWLGTEHDNEPAKALYLDLHPSETENGPIYTFKLAD